MKKTAVIGASGFIGRHLLTKYRTVFRDCIGTSFSKATNSLITFDIRKPNLDVLRLKENNYDAVIIASAKPNVAWCEANPKDAYEINVKGTLALIRQAEKASLCTIFLSSDYVFDGHDGHYSDHAETCPNTEYGRQKAEVEREISNLTNRYLTIRLSKIYGLQWQDGTLLDEMAGNLIRNTQITVAKDQFFSPTEVHDVVSMIQFLQDQSQYGLFNVCHKNQVSRYQIAMKLVSALNISPNRLNVVGLHSIPAMKNRPLNTSLQSSTIFDSMQSNFTSIENAVDRTAANWRYSFKETFAG